MQQVRALIERVGPTEARVLITGESGTGKELVAAAVHAASRRVNRAFVTVNCAAIPRDLVESEMFGHERGAFTGATERRLGPLRAGPRGHALPRRDRRPERRGAGQAAPHAGDRRAPAHRRGDDAADRRARRVGHQPAAGGRGLGRQFPGGSLLPAQRLPDLTAPAARAAGGSPRPRRPPGRAGAAAAGGDVHAGGVRRAQLRTPGPATCASWPIWSSGSASSAGPRWTPARCAGCSAAAPPSPVPSGRARPAALGCARRLRARHDQRRA